MKQVAHMKNVRLCQAQTNLVDVAKKDILTPAGSFGDCRRVFSLGVANGAK